MTYSALPLDAEGREVRPVPSAETRFEISPEGSCQENRCIAHEAGAHRITAQLGKGPHVVRGTAVLDVEEPAAPAAPDRSNGRPDTGKVPRPAKGEPRAPTPRTGSPATARTATDEESTAKPGHGRVADTSSGERSRPPSRPGADDPGPVPGLVLSPSRKFAAPGEEVPYTAVAYDASGRRLGDVTGRASFTITFSARQQGELRDGACDAAVCHGTRLGRHTVTGVVVVRGHTIEATAELQVVPRHRRSGTIPHLRTIEILPGAATIEAGDALTYTAQGYDGKGRALGDVTSFTVFTIGPDGSCTGPRCTAMLAGPHTVTGQVSFTRFQVSDTAQLLVTPRISGLRIEPRTATVEVGDAVSYTAHGVDASGRNVVDLTGPTTFSMSNGGHCRTRTCTPTSTGAHEVTGRVAVGGRVLTDTARIRAIPPVAAVELHPATAVAEVGRGVTFHARGLDADGHLVVDLTDATTFSIDEPGTCRDSICRAPRAGEYTVTGVVQVHGRSLQGSARLRVMSALTSLRLEPRSRTTTAGSEVPFVAQGLDGEGKAMVDLTGAARFTMTGPGSCTGSRCGATVAGSHIVQATVRVGTHTLAATDGEGGLPEHPAVDRDDRDGAAPGRPGGDRPDRGDGPVVVDDAGVDGVPVDEDDDRAGREGIPAPAEPGWGLWLLVGALVLIGGAATAARIRRQRRWVSGHVGVEPIPDAGTLSTRDEDPTTGSHSVHLATHTDEGSTTITEEEE